MKESILFFTLVFFSACSDGERVVEMQPTTCESYFTDTTFYQTLGTKEYMVYRICAPVKENGLQPEVYLYEDIGYMAEKKHYLFQKDSVNNCLYLDLYEKIDWLIGDEFRLYLDSKSYQMKMPDQALGLGREFSVNSCGSLWKVKFPVNQMKRGFFNIMGGKTFDSEEVIQQGNYNIITIPKNGEIKKGMVIRGAFFYIDGSYEAEYLVLP